MSKIIPLTTEIAIRQYTRKVFLENFKRNLKTLNEALPPDTETDKELDDIAEKVVELQDQVAKYGKDAAIANYLIIAREAMRPLFSRIEWCLTFPVYDDAFMELYALLYGLMKNDQEDLRYTRAMMSIFGESNEDFSEMLVNLFNPADPLNWLGVLATLAAPATMGGSLGVFAGIKALQQAAKQGGMAGVRAFLKRSAINIGTDATGDQIAKQGSIKLGSQVGETGGRVLSKNVAAGDDAWEMTKFFTQFIRGNLDAEDVKELSKAFTAVFKPASSRAGARGARGQALEKIDNVCLDIINANKTRIDELLGEGKSLSEISEILSKELANKELINDTIDQIFDVLEDQVRNVDSSFVLDEGIETLLKESPEFRKAVKKYMESALEEYIDELDLFSGWFQRTARSGLLRGSGIRGATSNAIRDFFNRALSGGFMGRQALEEFIEEMAEEGVEAVFKNKLKEVLKNSDRFKDALRNNAGLKKLFDSLSKQDLVDIFSEPIDKARNLLSQILSPIDGQFPTNFYDDLSNAIDGGDITEVVRILRTGYTEISDQMAEVFAKALTKAKEESGQALSHQDTKAFSDLLSETVQLDAVVENGVQDLVLVVAGDGAQEVAMRGVQDQLVKARLKNGFKVHALYNAGQEIGDYALDSGESFQNLKIEAESEKSVDDPAEQERRAARRAELEAQAEEMEIAVEDLLSQEVGTATGGDVEMSSRDVEELVKDAQSQEDELGSIYNFFDEYDDMLKTVSNWGREVTRLAKYWRDSSWQSEMAYDVGKVTFVGAKITGMRDLEDVFGKSYNSFCYGKDLNALVDHLKDILLDIATNPKYTKTSALQKMKKKPDAAREIDAGRFKTILDAGAASPLVTGIDKAVMNKGYEALKASSEAQEAGTFKENFQISQESLRKIIRKNLLAEIKKKKKRLIKESLTVDEKEELTEKIFSVFTDAYTSSEMSDEIKYLFPSGTPDHPDGLKNFIRINPDLRFKTMWNGLKPNAQGGNLYNSSGGHVASGRNPFVNQDSVASKTKACRMVIVFLELDLATYRTDELEMSTFKLDGGTNSILELKDHLGNNGVTVGDPVIPLLPNKNKGFFEDPADAGKLDYNETEYADANKVHFETIGNSLLKSYGQFIDNIDALRSSFKDEINSRIANFFSSSPNPTSFYVPLIYFISDKQDTKPSSITQAREFFKSSKSIKDFEVIDSPVIFGIPLADIRKKTAGKFEFGVTGRNTLCALPINPAYEQTYADNLNIIPATLNAIKTHNDNALDAMDVTKREKLKDSSVNPTEVEASGSDDGSGEESSHVDASGAREKLKDWIDGQVQGQNANSAVLIINNEPGSSPRSNTFIYEMGLAYYVYRHNLEMKVKSNAPSFYEGMYTGAEGKKGAKIDLSFSGVGVNEYNAIQKIILKHAKKKGIGVFGNTKYKTPLGDIVDGVGAHAGLLDKTWFGGDKGGGSGLGAAIGAVIPAYDPQREKPGSRYSAALFFKDLANGVDEPSKGPRGKKYKSSSSKPVVAEPSEEGTTSKINLSMNDPVSGNIVIVSTSDSNLYDVISKTDLEKIMTDACPNEQAADAKTTATIKLVFNGKGEFSKIGMAGKSSRTRVGKVITTAMDREVKLWYKKIELAIKNATEGKSADDIDRDVRITIKNDSVLNRSALKESRIRKVKISRAFKKIAPHLKRV